MSRLWRPLLPATGASVPLVPTADEAGCERAGVTDVDELAHTLTRHRHASARRRAAAATALLQRAGRRVVHIDDGFPKPKPPA